MKQILLLTIVFLTILFPKTILSQNQELKMDKLFHIDKNDINIGCVVYTETYNGIKAEWILNKNNKIERGTGIAKRLTELNPEKRFEGEYEIVYNNVSSGKKSPKLHLIISYESDFYTLVWKYNKKTTEIGIAIESDNKLVVGWTEVN